MHRNQPDTEVEEGVEGTWVIWKPQVIQGSGRNTEGQTVVRETGRGYTMKGLRIIVLESQLFPKRNRNPLKGVL